MNFTALLSTVFKGLAMGIAEAIPGVSGGTIAFISGIYERLMNVIKSFSPKAILEAFKNGGVRSVWQHIDGTFLMSLLGGMGVGILVGITGIHYLLERFPPVVWSFFFGLIIASAIYIGKQVSNWSPLEIVLLIGAAFVSFFITKVSPSSGSESLFYVFLCGAIAVSALILPGISGSFILLLMGMYTYILHEVVKDGLIPSIKGLLSGDMATVDTHAIITVIVFGSGMLIGLFTMGNILSWTFKKYKNQTLAVLTGFMIGSLNKIWPWQEVLTTRISSSGEEKILTSKSVLPSTFGKLDAVENIVYGNNPMLLACVLFLIVGIAVVFLLERLDTKEE